ncbi:unnamed protein product [Clavelina lepadiformis]|uniref:Uncharacterized protein n=1 Tax=Clavelina lepadiformis TaxID=159417 RepID=A0ABP0G0G0_CLALP
MHFPILLCQASLHSWKDSSRILRNSVVTAFLMPLHIFKTGFLDGALELGEEGKSHGARCVVMVKHPRVVAQQLMLITIFDLRASSIASSSHKGR